MALESSLSLALASFLEFRHGPRFRIISLDRRGPAFALGHVVKCHAEFPGSADIIVVAEDHRWRCFFFFFLFVQV